MMPSNSKLITLRRLSVWWWNAINFFFFKQKTAYEMLLSESQERMLIVAHAGREREVMDIFRKWDLDAVVIGRVRDSGRMQVLHNGETVANIPVSALTDEAPVYQRPMKSKDEVGRMKEEATLLKASEGDNLENKNKEQSTKTKDLDQNDSLLKLLASPTLASEPWVYRQYDNMVR